MNKHTQGPWEWYHQYPMTPTLHPHGGYRIAGGDEITVAIVSTDCDQDHANARMIAAAPDLLAALKVALPLLEQDIKDCGPCDHSVNVCVCGILSAAEQARAAIAKAEGKA